MLTFIKKLREGDEATKMRWLILFSAIAAVFVLFVWLKYFNSIVSNQVNNQQLSEQETERETGQNFSFWQTFKSGLEVTLQSIADGFHSIFSTISQPKNYMIKP